MEGITKRNKWSYCVGCVGRDMMFVLISMFILAYIQYTIRLSVAQFTAISAAGFCQHRAIFSWRSNTCFGNGECSCHV